MKKRSFLLINAALTMLLGLVTSACVSSPHAPNPATASGVYVHAGFEYYHWEGGLKLMIWHDGVNQLRCSSTTNGSYEIECIGLSMGSNTFEWRLETGDGITAEFSIDDHPYDLVEGSLFIIQSSGGESKVKQLQRDLSNVGVDAGSVSDYGLSDPDILAFIQTVAEINDCISNCLSSTNPQNGSLSLDVESAQHALMAFFSNLSEGDYESSVALYGGDYEVMRDHNPSIDPDDYAALFKNACTMNGAQCLEVRSARFLDQPSPAEFRFSVEFSQADGSLLAQGRCCGDDDPNHVDRTEFIYTVRYECAGRYTVLEMPVYLP